MTTRALAIATADALPFALVGTAVAFVGGQRLSGTGFALPLAALVGAALLAGLGGISLARVEERPFVLCRTVVNVVLFY